LLSDQFGQSSVDGQEDREEECTDRQDLDSRLSRKASRERRM
jgi:hypothetical protein